MMSVFKHMIQVELSVFIVLSLIFISHSSTHGCGITENNCALGRCYFQGTHPTCTFGCIEGYAGFFCTEPCLYCPSCPKSDPKVCTRCSRGRYGITCQEECTNCLNETCHMNGSCIEGCKPSKWGTDCNKTCPNTCIRGCQRSNGHCLECGPKSFGDFCNETCSQHCRKCFGPDCRTCNKTNGHCLRGCEEGFTGSLCEDEVALCSHGLNSKCNESCPQRCRRCNNSGPCIECDMGFYGTNCTTTCEWCSEMLCRIDGECLKGCVDGSTGRNCRGSLEINTESSTSSQTHDNLSGIVKTSFETNELLLPFFCSVVILCMMVTGVVVWKCSRRRETRNVIRESSCPISQETIGASYSQCGHIYNEIHEEDLDSLSPQIKPTSHFRTSALERPRCPLPGEDQADLREEQITEAYITPAHDDTPPPPHVMKPCYNEEN